MSQSVPWYGAGTQVPLLIVPTGNEGAGAGGGPGGAGGAGAGGVGGAGAGGAGGQLQFDVPHCGHGRLGWGPL